MSIEAIAAIIGVTLSLLSTGAISIRWIMERARSEFRLGVLETRVTDLEHRLETEVKGLSDRLLDVVVRLERITGALEAQKP